MKSNRVSLILATVVLAVGAFLAGLGIKAGENQQIMKKGVTVCTECIGIGKELIPSGQYEFRID